EDEPRQLSEAERGADGAARARMRAAGVPPMSANARPARARLAVLSPVYNEEENLERFAEQVTTLLLERTDLDVTVLFVDDGSSDGSWKLIRLICARDGRFRGIRLSRNFGAHTALSAGLREASGADAAVVLACDL